MANNGGSDALRRGPAGELLMGTSYGNEVMAGKNGNFPHSDATNQAPGERMSYLIKAI
jgi:hypothetical protein